MNERIQELSYQCWYNDPDTGKEEFNRTKLAELIVGECSRIADDWVNNEDTGKNYPSDKIKQHFGVEQ